MGQVAEYGVHSDTHIENDEKPTGLTVNIYIDQ